MEIRDLLGTTTETAVRADQEPDAATVIARMTAVRWTYGDKDPAALAIFSDRISEAGRRENVITYSALVENVAFNLPGVNGGQPYRISTGAWGGLDRRIVGDLLGYASYHSYKKHGFMVSALVVGKAEFAPSWHFFAWMEQLGLLSGQDSDAVTVFWVKQLHLAHAWYKANRRRPAF